VPIGWSGLKGKVKAPDVGKNEWAGAGKVSENSHKKVRQIDGRYFTELYRREKKRRGKETSGLRSS